MKEKELTTEELEELVKQGQNQYLLDLGHHYKNEERYLEAYQTFFKSASLGNEMGARFICHMIDAEYLDDFMPKVEQFNWLARYHEVFGVSYITSVLARFYKDGIGVKKNLSKYVLHLSECAEDGSSTCTVELARCYEEGYGVEQSYEKAYKLYYNYYDEHGKPDMYCLYKVAYYMYHELGGAKRDLEVIKRLLLHSGKYNKYAEELYVEIFNEPFPKEKR